MRSFLTVVASVIAFLPASGQDAKTIDKNVADALREVHDRGADLYNAGDTTGGYRMYQGGLVVARAMLAHRPEVQKQIADGLTAAEQLAVAAQRGFKLHEVIEQVRNELRTGGKKDGEKLSVPPREVKPGGKPSAGISEDSKGVLGRVIWNGMPLVGVDVIYITLGRVPPRVFETSTQSQGVYVMADIEPGRYVVLIAADRPDLPKKLPERYATSTTSPLVFDIKAKGEKLDFILQ